MRLTEDLHDLRADWEENHDLKALKSALGEVLAQLEPPGPDEAEKATILKQIDEANDWLQTPEPNLESETDREAREKAALPALREIFFPRLLAEASAWEGKPLPEPVIWRDTERRKEPVLSTGEICVLTGAGGVGKSYLSLALADAAARGGEVDGGGAEYGSACGLKVRKGPVALVSYEDAPERIAHRLKMLSDGQAEGIVLWEDPAPLWQTAAGGQSRPCPDWRRVWREIRDLNASLLIIDPASAALADVSTSETGPVRAFLRALTREAKKAGVGVLIVAHDTKASRNQSRRGEDPGAGVIAGSAVWYDGARGVLSLWRHLDEDRVLGVVKANYARTGWGVQLEEWWPDEGRFGGLRFKAILDRTGLQEMRKSQKESAGKASDGYPGDPA